MSSTYKLLCLSHDPAMVISDDDICNEFTPNRNHPALEDHVNCDIMIGAYSYPLVRVGCLGTQMEGISGCLGHHCSTNWIDIDWIQLLHVLYNSEIPEIEWKNDNNFRCWTKQRVQRIIGSP